ncbi:TonB C-terminal domain-containing protein [Phyllobacterium sp. P30BS-XVII]|uniref:energy transducer TonB n=1 Tax=Phyllobacterium sp. P30BS-XVII TaxID=2587046 RepID=UPI0015F86074|nr:TonB C-terminal domain-containing protein [Phyllobacterium sp. P30BS-XVII]MBA8899523.1 hypothetical protein [Phyllobacterium sp. P30BS-XVII]
MFGRAVIALSLAIPLGTSAVQASDKEALDLQVQAIAQKIRLSIQACWNIPDMRKDIARTVTVKFKLDKDGTIIGKPEIIKPSKAKSFDLLAKSSIRAIIRCAPYSVIAENPALYDELKEIIINFSSPEN